MAGDTKSWAANEGSRRSMQANKANTKLELQVRSLLHQNGLRYRVNRRPVSSIRRTADIVFGPTKIAVMLDGCFWHRCPEHATDPKRNAEWWNAKFQRTVERDQETNELLAAAGWLVLRYWEHEDADQIADDIATNVRARRDQLNEAERSSKI